MADESICALPANQSIIIADSLYKESQESVYNFTVRLSGAGIYCKELYYSGLYWCQPLYAHNNGNCELIFSVNNDDNVLYVVYATPFIIYNEYDGNIQGSSLLPPQYGSYCYNMELGLNGDVRLLADNATPVNLDGKVRSSTGNIITFNFRYSPSKGFCIYPVQDSPTFDEIYSIKLWPCSYIANAHYTHGFGIINPFISQTEFVPRSYYSPVVWSDTTPNLIPFRYVFICSEQLTKDRKIMSFSNTRGNVFVTNELAVLPVNPGRSRLYSVVSQGQSASVVSLRQNYSPQSFDILIRKENGDILTCGNAIVEMLQSNSVNGPTKLTYLDGPRKGRGDFVFTNYLIFGLKWKIGGVNVQVVDKYSMAMNSAAGHGFYQVSFNGTVILDSLIESNIYNYVFNPTVQFPISMKTNTPFQKSNQPVGLDSPFTLFFDNSPLGHTSFGTQFLWNYNINRTPSISLDLNMTFTIGGVSGVVQDSVLYVMMYDTEPGSPFNYTNVGGTSPIGVFVIIRKDGTSPQYFEVQSSTKIPVQLNPNWVPSSLYGGRTTIGVVFTLTPVLFGYDPNTVYISAKVEGPIYSGTIPNFDVYNGYSSFSGLNTVITVPEQYPFGNPLSDGKCEDLVHEIVTIFDRN